MSKLGDLSASYESNGDPGCISSGEGDAGGKSYGMYQLSSTSGSVTNYVNWCIQKDYWWGNALASSPVGSDEFDDKWKFLAESNYDDFLDSQYEFIKSKYYDVACSLLKNAMFDPDKHSDVMQDVIWSRAVQYGPGYIVEMFTDAVHYIGYANLSYVDDEKFDKDMIVAIYKNVCSTEEWTSGSPALRQSLYERFDSECQKAIAMLP